MILAESNLFKAERLGRFFQISLHQPHQVLSSSTVNGGMRSDITRIVNHQSCEGRGDDDHCNLIKEIGELGYHEKICGELELITSQTVLLSTAANMQYIAKSENSDGNLSVTSFITAGVKGNATRAGDKANWKQNELGKIISTKNETLLPQGTINIILLFNQSLSPSALAKSLVTLVEAKTAVLQELAVPSLSGSGLATGTGTDSFALATPENVNTYSLTFAGGHSKLGEITAVSVQTALREALRWQNGLEASLTRNFFYAFSRFGITEINLTTILEKDLPENSLQLWKKNREGFWHEPQLAAIAYVMTTLLDRVKYGTLSKSVGKEAIYYQLGLLASAVSHQIKSFPVFLKSIELEKDEPYDADGLTKLIARAISIGWQSKWK